MKSARYHDRCRPNPWQKIMHEGISDLNVDAMLSTYRVEDSDRGTIEGKMAEPWREKVSNQILSNAGRRIPT